MKPAAQSPLPVAPRRKRSLAIGACLGEVLAPHMRKQGVILAQLLPYWPSICPLLAEHAVPESIRAGTLTLAAQTSSVQRELHFLAPSILEGANRVLGYEALQQVRAVVRGASAKQTNTPKLASPLRPTAIATDKATAICQNVNEPTLKDALQRLGALALAK
jgi:hypothetical protein